MDQLFGREKYPKKDGLVFKECYSHKNCTSMSAFFKKGILESFRSFNYLILVSFSKKFSSLD